MSRPRTGENEIPVCEAGPSSDTVRERFATVDALRALAVVSVVAYEAFALVPALAHNSPALAGALEDASQGLTLFLMLSGFTLAYPAIVALTESRRAYLDVARFSIKRALRIYPAYLLALVLAVALPALALRYGLPAPVGARPAGLDALLRNAVFAGDGLDNDGFRAVALIVRLYLFFPLLLLLWSHSTRIFLGLAVVLAVLDTTTGLHALGLGAFVPFMLGIVAANVRATSLPAYRFGLPFALLAAAGAIGWGPGLAHAAALHAAPGALRVDPLWSLALFGLLAAVNAIGPLERVCAFAPLRLLGAASYAISLVVVPVSAFAVRQLAQTIGPAGAAVTAIGASVVVGFVLWQFVDRSVGDAELRRNVADAVGPKLALLLAPLRADRVVLGSRPPAVLADIEPEPALLEHDFYAPPTRSTAADLAVLSKRSGSPEDLAADILATKTRLTERSKALFADPHAGGAAHRLRETGILSQAQPQSDRKRGTRGSTRCTGKHERTPGNQDAHR